MTTLARSTSKARPVASGERRHPSDAVLRLVLFAGAWALGIVGLGVALAMANGGDRYMYWETVGRPLYVGAVFTTDDFMYSPIAAQALYPLSLMPWPVFWALFAIAGCVAMSWMLAPLGWAFGPPLFLLALPVTINGNIEWLMALVAVLGFGYAGLWAIPLLTKVSPAVGLVWFAVRREWHQLGAALAATAILVVISVSLAPWLWAQWVEMLIDNAQTRGEGWSMVPIPLAFRVILAAALVAWGARSDRRWTIVPAMMLARPDLFLPELAMLAALPRLVMSPSRPSSASG